MIRVLVLLIGKRIWLSRQRLQVRNGGKWSTKQAITDRDSQKVAIFKAACGVYHVYVEFGGYACGNAYCVKRLKNCIPKVLN